MAIEWKKYGRGIMAEVGHLFAYIETIEAYKEPGHPDYEPEHFEWFIAPDDEDKNYRRAIAGSDHDKIATVHECKVAVHEALAAIANKLLHDLCSELK